MYRCVMYTHTHALCTNALYLRTHMRYVYAQMRYVYAHMRYVYAHTCVTRYVRTHALRVMYAHMR